MYEQTLYAGWGDIDANGHMRNAAYLDKASDVRLRFFAEQGFSLSEFARQRLGPVIMHDALTYAREVGLLAELRVTLVLAGLANDGSRFQMRNDLYRADGQLAATVTSVGGWLDLVRRRLTTPPPALLAALQALPRSDDFQVLPTSVASSEAGRLAPAILNSV
jgi:acyl-CoA thioester hydrolase